MRLPTLLVLLLAAGAVGLGQTPWVDPSPHAQRRVQVGSNAAVEVLDWGGAGRPLVRTPLT